MDTLFKQTFKQAAIIAPAGKVDEKALAASVKLLERSGLKVKVMPHVLSGAEEDYLAAPLKGRLQDLHACWKDKSVDVIFCARGGFGSAHLLPHIKWPLLRTRRIPLVGYSDITALHMAMIQQKVGTPVVAPMPLNFKEALIDNKHSDYTRHYMELALAESIPAGTELLTPDQKGFNIIKSGYALGLPVMANLSVLASLCGTPSFPRLRNKILILEDLDEPVYKLDRYLTQLAQSGGLGECEALFFGQFTNCGKADERLRLFERFAKKIKGPVIVDFPFGHEFPCVSLNLRRHLRLEKNHKIFIIDT